MKKQNKSLEEPSSARSAAPALAKEGGVADVDLTAYRTERTDPEASGPSEESTEGLSASERLTRRITARLPGRLEIRVPVLIALVIVLMSWMQKHLQWSVPDMLKITGATLLGYPLLLSVVERLYRKHRKTIEDGIVVVAVQYLGILLQTWALCVLFVLALVPNLFFSSVTVLAAGVPGNRTVELRALDESGAAEALPQLTEGKTAHTFKLFTTPFGRSFVLKVSGYQHRTFTLYPGVGREFQLATLDAAPALNIRVPPESSLAVGDEGEIRVFRREDSGALTLIGAARTREFYGSYAFGELKGEALALEQSWSGDLEANIHLSESRLKGLLTSDKWSTVEWIWRRTIRTSFLPGEEPAPGQFLEVFYLSVADDGKLDGRAAFVVTEKPLQDHMLLKLSDDSVRQIAEDQPELFETITGRTAAAYLEAGQ